MGDEGRIQSAEDSRKAVDRADVAFLEVQVQRGCGDSDPQQATGTEAPGKKQDP